jgi:CHAT domain-containing protein
MILLFATGLVHEHARRRDIAFRTSVIEQALRDRGASGPRLRVHDETTSPRSPLAPDIRSGQTSARRALSADVKAAMAALDATLEARQSDDRPELPALPALSTLPERTLSALAAAHASEGNLARALAIIEPALERAPASRDLAATAAALFYQRGAPGDRARAFETLSIALEHAPADPVLLFNTAFIGDSILPAPQSRMAWERYLRVARSAGWRAYGQSRRDRLVPITSTAPTAPTTSTTSATAAAAGNAERALPRTSSDLARAAMLDSFLPIWSRACLDGASDEVFHLTALQSIAISPVFGADRFFRDVAARVTDSSGRCRARAAEVVAEFLRARDLYASDDFAQAGPRFTALSTAAADVMPPLALQSRLSAATTAYFTGSPDSSRREFDAVAREAERLEYYELAARAHWMRGYAGEDQSHFEVALAAYEAALEAFTRANSTDGIASGHNLLSNALDWLGQFEQAWRHREQALERLSAMRDSRARGSVLTGSIRALQRDGHIRTALQLANAKLAEDSVGRSPTRLVQALIEAGELQVALSHMADARATLKRAESVLARLSGGARSRLEARLLRVHAASERDPRQAIALLTRALGFYQESGSDAFEARLLLARARAALRAGDTAAADVDLRRGIAVVERTRADMRRTAFRLTYFDELWDLFDELLELTIARGAFGEALAVAEQARGRTLQDTRTSEASRALEITRAAPPRGVLAYYVVRRGAVVIWIADEDRVSTSVRVVTREELSAQVRQFAACVSRAAEPSACDARALEDLLLAPVFQHHPDATTLRLVLDPLLQPLPFAALRHPRTGRPLIESVTLSLLPSLASGSSASGASAPRGSIAPERTLVIGNPATREPMPLLPRAAAEARSIASLYPSPTLLTGEGASRSAFLRELPAADVVHFAGHAIADAEMPDYSRLLMSPDPDRRGNVYAHELERVPLPRAPVVVLAACETAAGRTSRSEGTISLARAFILAGARDVIATLWPIDDMASQPLFVAFHRELRHGRSPAEALRLAQLEMMRSADPVLRNPSTWASAVVWMTAGG